MKTVITILVALLACSCGEPDTKINADPNNATNNGGNNGSNNSSNNGGNNGSNNGPGSIDPGDYDQTCSVDQDCVLMNSGDPCGCHVCFDAAINVADQQTLQNDIAAAMCTEIACPAIACGEEQLPHCNAGVCDVRVAEYARAEEWDQSCSTAEDCVPVFEGEICACTACANAVINVADQADYLAQFDVSCQSGDDCACAEPEVACNEGRCELVD